MMSNDVWDAKGSRNPEPMEIKTAFYNIKSLFANPTQYLSRKVVEQIAILRSRGQIDESMKLASQYMETFYKGTYDLTKRDSRNKLYRDIIKGKNYDILKELFRFDNLGDPLNGFDRSINGTMVRQLISNKNFFESNIMMNTLMSSKFIRFTIFIRLF